VHYRTQKVNQNPVSLLRHAHATHALKRSADIKLVSATLGHSNVSVTNAYLDVQPGESSSTYLMEM
jgi:integrase/recombinase XerD